MSQATGYEGLTLTAGLCDQVLLFLHSHGCNVDRAPPLQSVVNMLAVPLTSHNASSCNDCSSVVPAQLSLSMPPPTLSAEGGMEAQSLWRGKSTVSE